MAAPTNLLYTNDHEWLQKDGATCRVGITHFAVSELGDIALVELPAVGATVKKGEKFGVIETTKSVSDLYAPVSGKVTKVNDQLTNSPELVNQDCYGKGWMIEIEPSAASEVDALLSPTAYDAILPA